MISLSDIDQENLDESNEAVSGYVWCDACGAVHEGWNTDLIDCCDGDETNWWPLEISVGTLALNFVKEYEP